MQKLGNVLEQEFSALLLTDPDRRLADRLDRYNRFGNLLTAFLARAPEMRLKSLR